VTAPLRPYDDRGDWLQTYTGRAFYPLDPRPEDVDPEDVAHALAHTCRYGGHTSRFYSVAEHCLLVAQAVPEHALWGLLHDAAEAYCGDMVRPLKQGMPAYREAEDRIMAAICERFGLHPVEPSAIKEADTRLLYDERLALFGPPPKPWHALEGLAPLGARVRGLRPPIAKAMWLSRLQALGGTR
jgi:hypothetical protein